LKVPYSSPDKRFELLADKQLVRVALNTRLAILGIILFSLLGKDI